MLLDAQLVLKTSGPGNRSGFNSSVLRVSIRKHRRRFQAIRRQQVKFAKAAGQGKLSIGTINPHMLWAYSRLALALQKAAIRRFLRTEWGRRHPGRKWHRGGQHP